MEKFSGKRNEKGWIELETDSTVGVEFQPKLKLNNEAS